MRKAIIILAALILIFSVAWAQDPQPAQEKTQAAPQPKPQQPQDVKYTNDSVARLSFVEGKTFIQRASDLGFEDGVLNSPISEGDRLGTSEGRMEVHFGRGNYIRLDNDSKLDVLNLPKKGDDIVRMRVWSGSMYLVVSNLAKEKGIEIHTADSSFYVLDKGIYRVNVRENRDTEVLVFRGLIEAAGEGGSTLIKAEQRLEVAEGRFDGKPSAFMAVPDDAFDRFNTSRNSQLDDQFAKNNGKRHLSGDLQDYESELDQNGQWTYLAPYGDVWVPSGMSEDWRPYYDGRWSYLGMSGWTWLPYESWGWAPYHYGRWNWGMDMGWYWIPSSIWGPAWVNWWWDDFYFGWGPMSYWGYPGFGFGFNMFGGFYGGYYGGFYGGGYPFFGNSFRGGFRGMTVVHRNQLKAPNISRVAVRDASTLRSMAKIAPSAHAPNVRPAGARLTVQPLNGNRVLLRKGADSGGLVPDRGTGISSAGRSAGQGASGTSVRSAGDKGAQGKTSNSPSIKKSGGSEKAAPARSSGSSGSSKSSGSSSSGARRIRKKDAESSPSYDISTASRGSSQSVAGPGAQSPGARSIRTYPSSPNVSRPQNYGDGGAARAGSFTNRGLGSPSYGGRSIGPSRSTRSGGSSGARISSRSGSSSGRSSVSRGSSSGSRGSSGSRSSGGGVRKK